MPRPSKRPGSSFLSFRCRTPRDVLDRVRGRAVIVSFPATGAQPAHEAVARVGAEVNLSLRTRDPALAKARTGIVVSQLEALWEAIRRGPKPLAHVEIISLSGVAYRLLAEGFEREPGSPERWIAVKAFNRAAREGRLSDLPSLQPHRIDASRDALSSWPQDITAALNALPQNERARAIAMEQRYGAVTDWVLASLGVVTDEESRRKLLAEIDRTTTEAAVKLKGNARGDYRPDLNAERFPSWEEARPPASKTGSSLTFDELFERWRRETEPAASTITTWRGHLRQFAEHLGHDDPTRVTREDVVSWKDSLVERGLKGIRTGHLATIKRLLGYAAENGLIPTNPAQGVTVARRRGRGAGKLPYEDDEVACLLSLAEKENSPARRWLPWLMALSGARVGELAQLWGNRVTAVDGIPVMKITPAEDGGSLKNEGSERDVPLHPALIERGFVEFARRSGDGPLFYGRTTRASRGQKRVGARHASKGVANHLAAWIREQGFKDKRKAPNHAFRHWFKSACVKAEIQERVADAIQGHAGRTVADVYRHIDLATKARAVRKIKVPAFNQATEQ